jgi:RimJ/RimL family protein N-acetyltransferase
MISGTKVKLRRKTLGDARDDYKWQTDPELARLDAAPLLTISFKQYVLEYTWELHFPALTRSQFAVEALDGKHIGNCACYDIDEAKGEAELGIMIGNRNYWDKGYGADAVITLISHIFQQTNLSRIYLKTLDSNIRAQKCFQKCGFYPYGHVSRDGYSFVLMEIHREQWQERIQTNGGV